jgi:hypothetical protein
LGSVLLKIDRSGFISYKVIQTDFPTCFPVNEQFYSTTDMFCNECNRNILSYHYYDRFTEDYRKICFHIGEGKFCVFSKHKIDNTHWKVIIYDSDDEALNKEVINYFDNMNQNTGYYEFVY